MSRVGGARRGGGGTSAGNVKYASSNYDIDERATGPIIDKKFEGHSDLQQAADKIKSLAQRKEKGRETEAIHDDIILNLHKQIATMEHEIKLLKDQEVDQKNQASGYETLLRDGIPLNEHFLALKNKFNNEQKELQARVKNAQAEIERDEASNENKRHRIEVMQNDYRKVLNRFEETKERANQETFNLESTMYTQNHTRTLLLAEKKLASEVLTKLKKDNEGTDRQIKQAKLTMAKKDAESRRLKEDRERLHGDVEVLNESILKATWILDQQKRKLNDRNLTKKAQAETMQARQEANLVEIDISIAESRIKDLENQKQMTNANIEEILTEKRAVDKENLELEYKIQGRGVTDADQKAKHFEAEREMTMKLHHSLQAQQDYLDIMQAQLTVEEKKCSYMLDLKITAEQTLDRTQEDAKEMATRKMVNKEDIIKQQLRLSQLKSQKKRLTAEEAVLTKENEITIKENTKYEADNEKLQAEIMTLIQRIDVSTLLKEIDMEEMRHLANQNINMNMAFQSLLMKWEAIKKQESEV